MNNSANVNYTPLKPNEIEKRNLEEEENDSALTTGKKRIFFSVLVSLCVVQTLFLNVASFLPTFVEENHP